MPAVPDASQIVLDTLGKLHERGYGMFGTCLDCSRSLPNGCASAPSPRSAPHADTKGGWNQPLSSAA